MKPTMSSSSDSKSQSVDVSAPADEKKSSGRVTKKHILISVVALLITGLVVVCVLVAVHLVTNNEKEIAKLSFKIDNNENVTQTVSADSDGKVVTYRLTQNGVDTVVMVNYGTNIKVSKVTTQSGTVACYVTPLNLTLYGKPDEDAYSNINLGASGNITVEYETLPDAISDISFLGTQAYDLCYNIPTYWTVPKCQSTAVAEQSSNSRQKREASLTIVITRYYLCYSNGRCYLVAERIDIYP